MVTLAIAKQPGMNAVDIADAVIARFDDLKVNLTDKHSRDRKSHEIASSTREPLQLIGERCGGNVKIVEVPPGPSVQSLIVAEVYGLDYESQLLRAKQIHTMFEQTDDVVDVDNTVETKAPRMVLKVDREKAAILGAFFILDDPIFNSLAVALLFGILVSTVLTLFVIPVLYYAFTKGNIRDS